MIGTTELTFLILLVIVLAIVIWWFAVAMNYKSHLNKSTYTKGANGTANENIKMKCGSGKKIYVYKATQICTNPDSSNFENSNLEPFSGGTQNTTYGDFDPNTTVDFTTKMGRECNGKNECTFKFVSDWSSKGTECNGESQLIATYDCAASPPVSGEETNRNSSQPENFKYQENKFDPPLPSFHQRFPYQNVY